MITQERLKNLLTYERTTGLFYWKTSKGGAKKGKAAGTIMKSGYRYIGIDRRSYRAPRLAWLYIYGTFPVNEIDHIDGIKDNNGINNLRDCTRKQNSENKKAYKSSQTGFIGVSYREDAKKYIARVMHNGKNYHLGYFITKDLAIKEVAKKRRELFTHCTM